MFVASALNSNLTLYQSASNWARSQSLALIPELQRRRYRASRAGLSVIILSKDRPQFIMPLLDQLLKEQRTFTNHGANMEIIVGDTGSSDRTVLARYREVLGYVRVCYSLEYHFSKNNNYLFFDSASCDTALFLNNDIILPESGEALYGMYACLKEKSFDVLGAILLFPDGTVQHGGIEFLGEACVRGLPYHPGARVAPAVSHLEVASSCPAVTGACLMIRGDLFEALGGFDPNFDSECQDIDLCLAVHRQGGRIGIGSFGRIIHIENGSRRKGEESWQDRQKFLRRWGNYIDYNFL